MQHYFFTEELSGSLLAMIIMFTNALSYMQSLAFRSQHGKGNDNPSIYNKINTICLVKLCEENFIQIQFLRQLSHLATILTLSRFSPPVTCIAYASLQLQLLVAPSRLMASCPYPCPSLPRNKEITISVVMGFSYILCFLAHLPRDFEKLLEIQVRALNSFLSRKF